MHKKLYVPLFLFICCLFQTFAEVAAPTDLKLVRATYTKVTIQWQYSGSADQIASYKVIRNNSEIATTSITEYTDTGLTTGTDYTYKIIAVDTGGVVSVASSPLVVKTIKSVSFDNSEKVEAVVDSFHSVDPTTSTALSLISGIKSGVESLLGTTITFSVVDSETLNSFVEEELDVIKQVAPVMTEAERQAAQAELNQFLADSYGGNTFEHVYIQSKLVELGEKHWAKGNKTAATALYEFSLKYLKDQEHIVSNTLNRMAYFKLQEINDTSTKEEIVAALDGARDTAFRFFDFFPGSKSHNAKMIYLNILSKYYNRFPEFLPYENYNFSVFNSAKQCATSILEISDDETTRKKFERIDAWELITLDVNFKDSTGKALSGKVKVSNVTANTEYSYLFPNSESMFIDEREFQIIDGKASIPVYKGHIYNFNLTFNIDGGVPLKYSIESMPYAKGKSLIYNNLASPATSTLADPNSSSAVFILDRPNYPYNLIHESSIDVFHLKWDWLESDNFKVKYFKVLRGSTVIDTVTEKIARNIPFESPDGIFTYTVIAYDENDTPSAASKPVIIIPEDTTPYADYFAWLQTYFGNQKTLSSDDPDGDGVSNYQEFLNKTDPSRVPGPQNVYAKQTTFTKMTLAWEPIFEGEEGVTYKIYRNDAEVGTSSTNSFTDTGLTPGLTFTYKIKAYKQDGWDSELGLATALTTKKPLTSEYAKELQQVIDKFNPLLPSEYTGTELVNAVKSGLEALLGTNITFSVLDEGIVKEFTEEELAVLREVVPSMTAAERLAAKNELNSFLQENYGGNSFEHVYMQGKLVELGEKHWAKENKVAATALYEASLNYLKDQEHIVVNTLSRLAYFKMQEITDTGTDNEIIAALDASRDTLLRFFEFFPESNSFQAQSVYTQIISKYYNYFPTLLAYNDYNQAVFDTVSQLSDSQVSLSTDEMHLARQKKVKAWELVNMKASIIKPDGSSASGTLIITNVSKGLFSSDLPTDEREFRLDGTPIAIPVFLGHDYKLTALIDVEGGPAIKHVITLMPHSKGQKVIYDHFNPPVIENLPAGNEGAELCFITSKPATPYNLEAETLPDEFTLSWDWVPPTSYQLQYFKVYRGGNEIGTAVEQQLAHIPRELTADSSYSYTVTAVDINNNETAFSPALNVYPEFTDEEKKYFDWKKSYFGDAPMLAHDDPDNDGLTNYQEFLIGSNPTVAPSAEPKAGLTQVQQGANVKYYQGTYSILPDFNTLEPYKEEVLQDIDFSTSSVILNSDLSQEVGIVFSGYFDVPESGIYRFYLASADGSKLLINGEEIIDNDKSHSLKEYRNDVFLNKGVNAIRIEYFNGTRNPAVLAVDWSRGNFSRTSIAPYIWTTSEENKVLAESIIWQRDMDRDGILDVLEYKYGTDFQSTDSDGDAINDGDEIFKYKTSPILEDTDGDGVSDYEEIFMSHSDPLVPDMDLSSIESIQKINGANFSGHCGVWRVTSRTQVYGSDRRGWLEYIINVPSDYQYRLKLNVRNYYPLARQTNLKLYVDGIYIGKKLVNIDSAAFKDVYFYLPWIKAGQHTIKVHWDNYLNASALNINFLELEKVGGPDANQNNVADWIESGISKICSVQDISSSRTSPAFIEGKAKYVDMASIDGNEIKHGAGEKWYANVPLSKTDSTAVAVSFQNGGKVINRTIIWQQTNIITEDGSSFTIRKGDSLLLNAFKDLSNGNSTGHNPMYEITHNGNTFTNSPDIPLPVQFDRVGEFTISAKYDPKTNDGGNASSGKWTPLYGSITVKVVDYSFYDVEPACWVARTRSWDIPRLPEGVILEHDDRFSNFEKSSYETDEQQRFDITIDDNQNRYILARLGENGPVLAQKRVKGFEIISSNKTYVRQIDEFEDGTTLVEMLIIGSPVISEVELRLHIFVAGVVFEDGSIDKVIKPSDFDASGQYRVCFLKPPEARTSVCHNLKAYQNNVYIGVRY